MERNHLSAPLLKGHPLIDDGLTVCERLEHFVAQAYKDDTRTLLHVRRVAQKGVTNSERIVGLAHDLMEDGKATYQMLIDLGLSREEVEACRICTRPEKGSTTTYADYINNIIEAWEWAVYGSLLAINVKYNDLTDHLRPATVRNITTSHALRYVEAIEHIILALTDQARQDIRDWNRVRNGDGNETSEISTRENRLTPTPIGEEQGHQIGQ